MQLSPAELASYGLTTEDMKRMADLNHRFIEKGISREELAELQAYRAKFN